MSASPRLKSSYSPLTLAALALSVTITGCVQPMVVANPGGGMGYTQAVDETDLTPPLPRFVSLWDCEQAYGVGACGTGAQVYRSVNMAPPHDASAWFIPFGFGVMTGVLTHAFFAPPTRYIVGRPYHVYTQPVVVKRYREVTPIVIRRYHSAPPYIREDIDRRGPWHDHDSRRFRAEPPRTVYPANPVYVPPQPPVQRPGSDRGHGSQGGQPQPGWPVVPPPQAQPPGVQQPRPQPGQNAWPGGDRPPREGNPVVRPPLGGRQPDRGEARISPAEQRRRDTPIECKTLAGAVFQGRGGCPPGSVPNW